MTKARSNAVAEAAKGDLSVGSGTNLAGILAVGNNGETLVADSSTSTGLRYQVPVQNNPVLNSAYQIWQRGTSITGVAGGSYTADRWYSYRGSSATGYTTSRQVTGDTTNLPNIQYCLRLQRDNGNTSTASLITTQPFETVNSIPFAGKTVTLSFYARKGANFSSTSSQFEASIYYGTGTDQAVYNGYTGVGAIGTNSLVATTTWQRFTYTGTLPSTVTEFAPFFIYNPTGTAGAADYLEITGVQLEVGSVATPFHTYAGTIQGELGACQRYYQRFGGYTAYENVGQGSASSATRGQIKVCLPVTMRTSATSVDYSTLNLSDGVSGFAVTSVTIDQAGKNMIAIFADVASGLTQYRNYFIYANNSTSAYLGFSAEL